MTDADESHLNDQDLKDCLGARPPSVPQDLDRAILKRAREAVETDAAARSVGGLRTVKRWTQGLSAVAVVVLAIVLVPMLKSQDPETLEVSTDAFVGGSAGVSPIQSAERSAFEEPALKLELPQARATQSLADAFVYRQSVSTWLDEIQRLYTADLIDDARTEVTLFKARHPEHPSLSQLPVELMQ